MPAKAYHERVRNEIGPMLAGGEHEKARKERWDGLMEMIHDDTR